jgi:hypothetical protein
MVGNWKIFLDGFDFELANVYCNLLKKKSLD